MRTRQANDQQDGASAARGASRMHRAYLKYRAKLVLTALGLRVRPGGRSRKDLQELLDHLKHLGFRPVTVVDIGVADGTFELYESFPEAQHLLLEAAHEFEPVLRWIARRYQADYLVAAADERTGSASLEVSSDLHDASLLDTRQGSSRMVPTVTVDAACRERGLRGPYLVKVDVQGAELRALAGASGVLEETEVVVIEASLFEFRTGIPEFSYVLNWMRQRGFVVYDIIGGYTRPLDGALAQVDLAFVRVDGRFRSDHRFATPEQDERHRRSLISRARRRLGV